ncbi:hypothetical protein ACQPX6_19855 [Actinomycetospora sp. CA-101289]|uniref:hypothetical protein n=1 Tax=Actinomycetospora sp. CA-101289 TaxID=3239893 RepID=UPI003D970811
MVTLSGWLQAAAGGGTGSPRVLGVAESGSYEALTRTPSARAIHHARLTDQIRQVHQASHGTSKTCRLPG